jgi:hypothetical protein
MSTAGRLAAFSIWWAAARLSLSLLLSLMLSVSKHSFTFVSGHLLPNSPQLPFLPPPALGRTHRCSARDGYLWLIACGGIDEKLLASQSLRLRVFCKSTLIQLKQSIYGMKRPKFDTKGKWDEAGFKIWNHMTKNHSYLLSWIIHLHAIDISFSTIEVILLKKY